MKKGVFVESSGRFWGLMLEKAVHCLGILHYGWAWNLASKMDGPSSEAKRRSMSQFYAWLGKKKSSRIRLAVMDMWKPFRLATNAHAPQAAILFDKFHVIRHLGEALDAVRKSEYARLQGRQRRYIKGQKYTLLSRRENLSLDGKKALKVLLAANRRLNTAYVLKESFGQLWSYEP